MMELLFVAPGARAPWTEGRKNMVRDLVDELLDRGYRVRVLTGSVNRSAAADVVLVLLQLCRSLWTDRRVHVVQFPFGRFSGIRGWVNRGSALAVRCICRVARVSLLTVVYSVDGMPVEQARRWFGPLAAVGSEVAEGYFLHLGVDPITLDNSEGSFASPGQLLFLCGYQDPSEAAVAGVLDERGLRHLFEACGRMSRALELTVAIPFLRDSQARSRIAAVASELCPNVALRLDGSMRPADALRSHDAFVFPYLAEHEVFVSTALLEALLIGVPVVARDRRMYRSLTRAHGQARCILARDDSIEALSDAIGECLDNLPGARAKAAQQCEALRAEWSRSRMTDDLVDALQDLG